MRGTRPADYLTVGDPVPDSMRLASTNITLDNVIIVAAGGVWAPELQPVVGTECSYPAPELIIQGSVITGHAGATSRLWDCDGDSVPEMIAAGYDRSSELPGSEAWATADIAWWPERQHGVWRRQGAPVRVTVDAGSTVDPGLSVNPATVTVTEGSTARLVAVALATQPSADCDRERQTNSYRRVVADPDPGVHRRRLGHGQVREGGRVRTIRTLTASTLRSLSP